MKKWMYLLFVFTALFSCKKKVFENTILIPHEGLDYVDCNCPSKELDLDFSFDSPSVYTVFDETQYYGPQINPNNSDEIAFFSNPNGDDSQTQLIVYNIVTQEKRVLVENLIQGTRPSWGKKDWILFMSGGYQLYKIKSSGDSLTPIGNGQWLSPSWNASGDKIVVGHRFKSIHQPRTFILNEYGEVLDSINDTWANDGSGNWSHPEYYLRYDSKNIYLMNLEENKVLKKIKLPFYYPENGDYQIGAYTKVGWLSPSKLIFDWMGGFYTYDLTTDKVQHIKCTCESIIFTTISCSSDYSKVVFNRLESHLIENNQKYFVDNKLFLLNPVTLEEEEIIIP